MLAQKFPISLIPATSNQKTEFNAWCNPVGISKRLKNPYKPAPTAPNLLIDVPKVTKPEKTTGQTNNRIIETTIIAIEVIIGAKRFPLKKASAVGSLVVWKRLYIAAATNPEIIPMNALLILPKAGLTASTSIPCNIATEPELSKVVITKKATKPLSAAAPSLSFDIPRDKPTANNTGKLSITAEPALIKKAA